MTVQSGRHQATHAAGGREASGGRVSDAGTEQAAPAFVGRDDSLTAVVNALEHGPALVLIEGEAGIGKTRLLREALASHADRMVLVAACPPLPEPFPLGPVVDGVRRLRPQIGEVGLSLLGGALRPLFPEWIDQLPPALESLDDPKETRHRAFSALSELAERLGVEVLVVEDAHWADTATLEWLLTLVTSSDQRMSIVVTYRPSDAPEGSLLPRLTSRPATDVAQVRVELEPLDVEQARRLVASMLVTDEVSEEFAAFLYERTDGVPLALEETVRLLRDRRDIVRQGGRWTRRVLDELQVPPTVRDSVLERVERLDPPARAVLEAAAVLAAPSDDQLLATVAGLDVDTGQAGLAGALRSGLLQETDPGRFVFRHVLDAEAVGEATPVSRRRNLHARAAEALQQRDPEPIVRLARHFREAGDTEAWCHYAEAAADLAWESGDDHNAVTTLLDVLTSMEHPADQHARLARKLGEAAFFGTASLGDLAERVVSVLRVVLTTHDLRQADRGEIRLHLGRMLWVTDDEHAALAFDEFEAAVPDLGHRPDLAVRAMTNLAMPRIPEWPARRHLQWLERATALLPEVESSLERLSFKTLRASALLLLGEEAGWRAAAELPRSATSQAEQQTLARGLLNVALDVMLWGRYEDARALLAAAAELVDATDYRRYANAPRLVEAYLDWYAGVWDDLRDAAADLATSEETTLGIRREARQILGLLDLASGARSAAEGHLRVVVGEYERLGMAEPMAVLGSAGLGRLLLADGDAVGAMRATSSAVDMIVRKGVWLWATDVVPAHLTALISAGKLDEAEALVEQFAAGIAGLDAAAPAAALVLCGGMLAQAHADLDRATHLFAEAASAWAMLPRPYDELLALERRGRCLLDSGNKDEALAVLSEVEQRLTDLGAKWDADRVAHLLRHHGVEVLRTWRRGRRGYGDQLSPREREVVELVARGMTNKQIGESLFISPGTVKRHLQAAMRKLDVSSRTALAMVASEAGLLSADTD